MRFGWCTCGRVGHPDQGEPPQHGEHPKQKAKPGEDPSNQSRAIELTLGGAVDCPAGGDHRSGYGGQPDEWKPPEQHAGDAQDQAGGGTGGMAHGGAMLAVRSGAPGVGASARCVPP